MSRRNKSNKTGAQGDPAVKPTPVIQAKEANSVDALTSSLQSLHMPYSPSDRNTRSSRSSIEGSPILSPHSPMCSNTTSAATSTTTTPQAQNALFKEVHTTGGSSSPQKQKQKSVRIQSPSPATPASLLAGAGAGAGGTLMAVGTPHSELVLRIRRPVYTTTASTTLSTPPHTPYRGNSGSNRSNSCSM